MSKLQTSPPVPLEGVDILHIDDHLIFSEALHTLFQTENIGNFISCTHPDEIERLPDQFKPRIILLDVNLQGKNGLDYIPALNQKYGAPILVLTGHNVASFWKKDRLKLIHGLVFKTESFRKLLNGIQSVLNGTNYFPADIANKGTTLNKTNGVLKDAFSNAQNLTPREKETLKLICEGKSVDEIGKELYLSKHTVIVHRRNLYKKFAVNSLLALYAKAHALNIYDTL